MALEFPEYAVKFSKDAKESRDRLPAQARAALSEILDELTETPDQYPDRITPASLDGRTLIYTHPEPRVQLTYEIDQENKVIYFFHFSATSLEVKKTVFISYSHKDRHWLDKCRGFLTVLEQQEMIKFWDDSQLEAGKPWEAQIKEVLDSASVGVLLVSQDFLSSKFITETELPKLLEGEDKSIFWLPLSPSTVFSTNKEITKYQSLLRDPQETTLEELEEAQQKKVFVEMSEQISEAVTKH